jgi:pilus assembly protein CpaB
MSRSKTVLGVAIALGLLAALAGYAGLRAAAAQVAHQSSKHYVPVVVTATDLTFGTKLDRAQLRIARYPKESVPAGAFSDIDSVADQTTKIFLAAREPITATKLSSRGGGLSMLVRPNMRAASLEVNQVSGVSGFVLPGDRVDILATIEPNNTRSDAVTRTVLQNIEVLASGQKTEQRDNKPITVQSVTILVDPDGAETLALAMHEGKIHLVLRNPEDQELVKVASLSTQEMLGHRTEVAVKAPSGPRRVTAGPAPVAAMRPAPPPKVRMIRSASITETNAVADSTNN